MKHFALGLLLLCNSAAFAEDWPQWLGPNRDGSSTETVLPWKSEPKLLWKTPVGEGHSSPIIAAGKVFLHCKVADVQEEEVSAYDAGSGKQLWRQTYKRTTFRNIFGNGPRSTPLHDEGRLYTLGVTGILSCWDAGSGKLQWQKDLLKEFNAANLFFGVSTSPLVMGDLLLIMVGGKNTSVVALDKRSGELRWQRGDDKASYASPAAIAHHGQKLAVFLTAAHVVALDPTSGTIVWQTPLKDMLNESSSTPVKTGDFLFATSVTYGGVLYKCVEKDSKPAVERLWHQKELTCYFGTPIAMAEHLFLVTGSYQTARADLHCVELKTGKTLWTKPKVGKYHATLLRTKDRMLMLEEEGDLVLFEPDASGYKELARAKVCGRTWAHPALADRKFFIRDNQELRCVDLAGKE